MTAIIDAHHHFWRTGLQEQPWRTHAHSVLARDFEPADLDPELDAAGVDATVLMQSVDEPAENRRLAEYAHDSRVAGVVAWLPVRDARAARAELDELEVDKLVGVRCLIADDPLEHLTSSDSLTFFRELADRELSWDVVPITAAQTRQVISLAEAVPELHVIVDHLGRPPIDTLGWEPWATNIAELARNPGVAIKVSVGIDALTQWSQWNAPELERYVEHVCAQFGPDRVMLASNWPVVLLRASYGTAWADLRRLVSGILPSSSEQGKFCGGNAAAWYRLPGDACVITPANLNTTISMKEENTR